jgi:hypothetical protein
MMVIPATMSLPLYPCFRKTKLGELRAQDRLRVMQSVGDRAGRQCTVENRAQRYQFEEHWKETD